MNDDAEMKDSTFVQVKAPVTGWEVLMKFWWVLVVVFGIVVYVLLKDSVPVTWQYGYLTFVAVFAVVYWFLGQPDGWALDTTEMDSGHVGLVPLNRYQIETIQSKPDIMMFASDEGPVALVGHGLVSLDDEGKLLMHAPLQLKTNSEIVRAVARSQLGMINEYLLLKSEVEVAVSAEFKEMYDGWRMKTRMDPESQSDSD